jgi:hypothetical protein
VDARAGDRVVIDLTKHYADAATGAYLGAFAGAPQPDGSVSLPEGLPAGAIEVPAPADARQVWDAAAQRWSDPPAPVTVPVPPTPLEWFQRLSMETQLALVRARRTDDDVDLAMTLASGAAVVHVADPLTIAQVRMLAAKTRPDGSPLISADEATALLAP